ncbi:glutathione S-transferase [Lineolata rhizophorae]|uniref:Glutathione S-transferase n=1 Tax=Lineolata rhizophorae TaxID=578093 RepID=A0A6A6NQQ0_9PEZI|nr:glutathione S-transferase [Lineolata rhizophorae]
MLLEELKDAYGTDYTFQSVNIGQNTQKEPWFTKLGPNGRIPVLVDHDRGGISLMEGAAILNYLVKHYDPEHKFSFSDDDETSDAEQWVAWQHGGLGPMQGQANHFVRYAKEFIPYGIFRYVGETERLYGVLDMHLEGRDYIAGKGKGKFSYADCASWGWVNSASFIAIDLEGQFSNVAAWWKRINDRPAVQRGLKVPSGNPSGREVFKQKIAEDPEFRQKEEEVMAKIADVKKQYNYVYKSP